jgi:hypothetical protein
MRDHKELDDFINGLSFSNEEEPGESVKLAKELEDLPESALLEMVGIDTRTPEEKTAMAYAEKASGLRCGSMGFDNDFLSQFEGSPLYGQAIAVAEQELEMEKNHVSARAQRRMQEQQAGSWEQESQERDMIDIQKRQLELELHKSKAQSAAMAAAPVAAPAEAPADPAAAAPAAAPEEGIPAEAPPEAAAEKMAAASLDPKVQEYLQRQALLESPTFSGVAPAAVRGTGGAALGGLAGAGVGGGLGAVVGRPGMGAALGGTLGGLAGAALGGRSGMRKGQRVAAGEEELRKAQEVGKVDSEKLSPEAQRALKLQAFRQSPGKQGLLTGSILGAPAAVAGAGMGHGLGGIPGAILGGGAGAVLGGGAGYALGRHGAEEEKKTMKAVEAARAQERKKTSALTEGVG